MALTPEQIAELERLKALMRQPAADAQRKAQAAWNAEQMANKKADGGSMDLDAMRLALMGKKRHMAYGGPARNWAPGEEEKLKKHINRLKMDVPALVAPEAAERYGIDIEDVKRRRPHAEAINQWLDSVAHNYVKKSMATEKDPVRQQAENDVLHLNVPEEPGYWNRKGETRRKISGGEQMAKSDKAKTWENRTDAMLEAEEAQAHQDMMHLAPGMYSEKDEWVKKLDPKAKLWNLTEHFDPADLGLDHIRDVLHEDLVSGRIRPEQLSKISMSQAVQRAHQYDQEMEKKRQETAIKQTEGMQTVHEYPEEGLKWIELAMPKELPEGWSQMEGHGGIYVDPEGKNTIQHPGKAKLEEALKYEGSAMGHCVGGYCPDVMAGRSRIFSLRDKKGEPHVTIETEPYKTGQWLDTIPEDEYKKLAQQYKQETESESMIGFPSWASQFAPTEQRIVQIKGKGNRKPHKKYIPHVQHFVKSGKWSEDIGDYDNTDLLRVGKDQHATKEELESLGRHHYPEHNMPAENVLMHYDRMRGMPEHQNEQTKNFMADLESGNYRTPPKGQNMKKGGVIKKAMGGGVQPSLEQMKTALMKQAKPNFNDMRNVGVNEAPGLNIKAFVPPTRNNQGPFPVGGVSMGDQPLPMGGVDMSQGQPGNQLMPANMAQPAPQGQPGQPPQGMPSPLGGAGSPPPPQGGSNILQMTPQGQAMAAMKPQGMADGGGITSLGQLSGTANSPSVPQFSQGGLEPHPLPTIVKDPSSMYMPADNQNMDNGATNYSIDNFQQLANGGQVQGYASKGYVQHTPSKPHPEVGTRFTSVPQGNLVKDKPLNLEDYENKGSIINSPYDATTRDNLVSEISGHNLINQLLTEAGFRYSQDKKHVKQNIGGASNLGIAGRQQGRVDQAFQEHGGDVLMMPSTMSDSDKVKDYPENFSHHPTHILLDLMKQRQFNKNILKQISDDLRSQHELIENKATKKKVKIYPYKNFIGFDHPMAEDQLMNGGYGLDTTAGNLRKKMVERLGSVGMQKLLDYNIGDMRAAILDPDIATDPKGFMGAVAVQGKPGAPIRQSGHTSYDSDVWGKYKGGFKNRPIEIVQPDVYTAIDAEMRRNPKNKDKSDASIRAQVIGAIEKRKEKIAQPINARVINNAGLYEEGLKQGEFDPKNLDSILAYYKRKGGFKKGGKVKMHTDMDTINLELSNKRKKAK